MVRFNGAFVDRGKKKSWVGKNLFKVEGFIAWVFVGDKRHLVAGKIVIVMLVLRGLNDVDPSL